MRRRKNQVNMVYFFFPFQINFIQHVELIQMFDSVFEKRLFGFLTILVHNY